MTAERRQQTGKKVGRKSKRLSDADKAAIEELAPTQTQAEVARALNRWPASIRSYCRERGIKCARIVPKSKYVKRPKSPWYGIVQAFAERFGVGDKRIYAIGTSQLCLCRSDEARRLLLHDFVKSKSKRAAVFPTPRKPPQREQRYVVLQADTAGRIDKLMRLAGRRRA